MSAPNSPGVATPGPAAPIIAGVVTSVVGFTSSFAVVLTALVAVGASSAQAASGLLILCLTMGTGSILFSLRYRIPITMAWSTPGAALLAATAAPAGGFASAVGAFIVAGVLIALCGAIRPLGTLIAAIPSSLANAMLAGVLLSLCVAPIRALAADPAAIAGVIAVWLLLTRFAPRWAVPGALAAAVAVIVIDGSLENLPALAPGIEVVTPSFSLSSAVAIGLPLFLVTMTSQNIPGMAVLASFGYRPPLGPPLVFTGFATVAGAPFGGHAINLAAISAALAAGPQAHPDPDRRWIAGVTAGAVYLVIAPLSGAIAAIAQAAPAGLLATIAGLALIGTFASAGAAALSDLRYRDSAAVTFLVAASGVSAAGIGAAFWALVSGGVYLLLMQTRRDRSAEPSR